MMIDSAFAVGFRTSRLSSFLTISGCRLSLCNFEDPTIIGSCCRRESHRFRRSRGISRDGRFWRGRLPKRNNTLLKNRIQASAATPDEHSEPSEHRSSSGRNKPCYHPFEELGNPLVPAEECDAQLTDAEITRTMMEVNNQATMLFSGTINDEVHENIFWPELPYVIDEHGDIYFEVRSDEDVLQSLTAENNFVQVLIGLDNVEVLTEMALSGPPSIDFDIQEIDSDVDDDDDEDDEDDDEDWVAILEDEEDDSSSSEALGDWANLDTMRSSHPMYFARKIAEVVSNPNLDSMDLPSTGLAIQGVLRPAFIEEQAIVRKHMASRETRNDDTNQDGKVLGGNTEGVGMPNYHALESGFRTSSKDNAIWQDDLEEDGSLRSGASFYKLEMIDIQLVSAYGKQTSVDVNDFRLAQPDVIAHSASKIISRLNAGGEKTLEAIKSLCWRIKGIQVEEATVIGVDSLGFDLRVCSGTQVQTLRFSFNTRATSEFSAERQLHDLMFPRIHQNMLQKQHEARSKEC